MCTSILLITVAILALGFGGVWLVERYNESRSDFKLRFDPDDQFGLKDLKPIVAPGLAVAAGLVGLIFFGTMVIKKEVNVGDTKIAIQGCGYDVSSMASINQNNKVFLCSK